MVVVVAMMTKMVILITDGIFIREVAVLNDDNGAFDW